MAKYLVSKAGLTFEKVFGEHKNLAIGFLVAQLPLDMGKKIKAIEYLRCDSDLKSWKLK